MARINWVERGIGGYKYVKCECGQKIETDRPHQERVPYCSACSMIVHDAAHRFCGWCGEPFEDNAGQGTDTAPANSVFPAALKTALTALGGIYKRIDELREDYALLQEESAAFLNERPWVTAHWISTDDYLVGLAEALDPEHHLGPIPFRQSPPSAWPFPRPKPYDKKGASSRWRPAN